MYTFVFLQCIEINVISINVISLKLNSELDPDPDKGWIPDPCQRDRNNAQFDQQKKNT